MLCVLILYFAAAQDGPNPFASTQDSVDHTNPFAVRSEATVHAGPSTFAGADARGGTNASAVQPAPNMKCCCARKEPEKYICVPLPEKGSMLSGTPKMEGETMYETAKLNAARGAHLFTRGAKVETLSLPVTTRTTSVCSGSPKPGGDQDAQKAAAVISMFGAAKQAEAGQPAWAAAALMSEADTGKRAVEKLQKTKKGWFGTKKVVNEIGVDLLGSPVLEQSSLDATRLALTGQWSKYGFAAPKAQYKQYSSSYMKDLHIVVNGDVVYRTSKDEIEDVDGAIKCTHYEVGAELHATKKPERAKTSREPVHGKRPYKLDQALGCKVTKTCTEMAVVHACGWEQPDSTLFERVGRMGQCMPEEKGGGCPSSHFHHQSSKALSSGGFRFCDCGKQC